MTTTLNFETYGRADLSLAPEAAREAVEAWRAGMRIAEAWLSEPKLFAPGRGSVARAAVQALVYAGVYGAEPQTWPNWHINRGRMSHNPTRSERRRVSWRRAL